MEVRKTILEKKKNMSSIAFDMNYGGELGR